MMIGCSHQLGVHFEGMCWGCHGLKNVQLEVALFWAHVCSSTNMFYAEVFAKTLLLMVFVFLVDVPTWP
jgi:hypothetical protein